MEHAVMFSTEVNAQRTQPHEARLLTRETGVVGVSGPSERNATAQGRIRGGLITNRTVLYLTHRRRRHQSHAPQPAASVAL
jgi:hypothetical protein